MTGKHFYVMAAAVILFMGLLLFWGTPVKAKNHDWNKIVLITEWCISFEVLLEFADLLERGNNRALPFLGAKIVEEACFKNPPGISVAFKPTRLIKTYPNLIGLKAHIISGFVLLKGGKKRLAFVLVPDTDLKIFQELNKKPSEARPERKLHSI